MVQYISLFPDAGSDVIKAYKSKLLGEAPYIHPTTVIRDSHIGCWTDIGPRCSMMESSFGDYSYVAGDASIVYSEIGKFCSIAAQVRINPGNHPMHRVTQHHLTYRRVQYGFDENDDKEFFNWRRAHRCVIGHDVWIGHGATIMPGVHIGIGAVVGAGAVITHNILPYQIVAGVPGRLIRQRFPDHIVERLLRIAWWDWDRATLEARFDDLMDVEAFIAKYG